MLFLHGLQESGIFFFKKENQNNQPNPKTKKHLKILQKDIPVSSPYLSLHSHKLSVLFHKSKCTRLRLLKPGTSILSMYVPGLWVQGKRRDTTAQRASAQLSPLGASRRASCHLSQRALSCCRGRRGPAAPAWWARVSTDPPLLLPLPQGNEL